MASHLVDLLVGRNLGLAYKRGLVGVLYVSLAFNHGYIGITDAGVNQPPNW